MARLVAITGMTPVGRLNVYIYTHDLHVDNFTAYFVLTSMMI